MQKTFLSLLFLGNCLNVQAQTQTLCEACVQYRQEAQASPKNTEHSAPVYNRLSCLYPNEKLMCNLVGIKSFTMSRLRKGAPPANIPMETDYLAGERNGKHLIISLEDGDILAFSSIKGISKSGSLITLKGFSLKITPKNPLPRYSRLKDRWIELPNILPEMKDLDKDKIQIASFWVNGEEHKAIGFDANLVSDDANISKVKATYKGKPLPVADFVWKWE